MNKVLVTGASGFLGSNLIRELYRQGFDVKIIVRQNANLNGIADVPCEVFYGNIDNQWDVRQAISGCNIVIHAACITDQWAVSFDDYERVNYMATKYIADACIEQKISKFIYVSTANTMGPGTKHLPGTELSGFTLFNANSGYINSKYLAQQYVLEQVEARALPGIVINPTFMIGPNDIKPSSGKLLLYGLRKRILFYPPGGKNFVYIQDVCRGIINAISKGRIGDCYLLAGHNLTYREFFGMVSKVSMAKAFMIKIPAFILKLAGQLGSVSERVTGKPSRLNRTAAHLICLENYYSGKKSERELQLEYTSMQHAVENAFNWFKDNNYC